MIWFTASYCRVQSLVKREGPVDRADGIGIGGVLADGVQLEFAD